MIRDDGTVLHFNNPKVQASLAANTFAVTGHAENKQLTEMLPGKKKINIQKKYSKNILKIFLEYLSPGLLGIR